MKARPRKHVTPGRWIAILRLMHMPQDHQVNAVHRGTIRVFIGSKAGRSQKSWANEGNALPRISGMLEWRL